MSNDDRVRNRSKEARRQLHLPIGVVVKRALLETVISAGLAWVEQMLERAGSAVRTTLSPSARAGGAARGHSQSSLVLGGRRIQVQRPRVRSRAGGALVLPSWRSCSARDPLDQRPWSKGCWGLDPSLCALAGSAARVGAVARSPAQCGEPTLCEPYRAQAERVAEPQSCRRAVAGADARRGPLRAACGVGGVGNRPRR